MVYNKQSESRAHWRYFEKSFIKVFLDKSPKLHMNFVQTADFETLNLQNTIQNSSLRKP